jgi:hypothetical protein
MSNITTPTTLTSPAALNPGVSDLSGLYYSPSSVSMNMAQVSYTYGTEVEDKSACKFGTTASFKLTTTGFSGSLWCAINMQAVNVANVCFPRGWGIAMINHIKIAYGGSGATYIYDGSSLLHMLIGECENRQKMNDMLCYAGREITTQQDPSVLNVASFVVHAAHSSMNGASDKKKPFELDNNSITVTIEFKQLVNVASGSGVAAFKPTFELLITHKVADLKNRALSISDQAAAGLTPYIYPYFHPESHTALRYTSPGPGSNIVASDTTLKKGQIEAIMMTFHASASLEDVNDTSIPINPLETLDVYDLNVTLSKSPKYVAPAYLSGLIDLTESRAGLIYDSVGPNGYQTTSPFLMKSFSSKVYLIPFTNDNLLNSPDETENVLDYGGAPSLAINFKTNLAAGKLVTVLITSLYKGVIQYSGKTTTLIY